MHKIYRDILSHEWRFATTMPENPHWYTLRKDWNDIAFVYFVKYIREFGYTSVYGGKTYIKLNVNGYTYWTMGEAINKPDGTPYTILINRAVTIYDTNYDKIADKYETLFIDKKSIEQDKKLLSALDIKGRVLDVGCGTGLLLDYINLSKYVGIDVSSGMLSRLKKKYKYAETFNTSVTDYFTYKKFDTIVGLYGVGSYLTDGEFNKLKRLLDNKGKIYIISYKEGYIPVTYKKTGVAVPSKKNNPDLQCVEFDEFLIYTNDKILLEKWKA